MNNARYNVDPRARKKRRGVCEITTGAAWTQLTVLCMTNPLE